MVLFVVKQILGDQVNAYVEKLQPWTVGQQLATEQYNRMQVCWHLKNQSNEDDMLFHLWLCSQLVKQKMMTCAKSLTHLILWPLTAFLKLKKCVDCLCHLLLASNQTFIWS